MRERGKRWLLIWAVICLITVVVGSIVPVEEMRSQGLEGANQANIRSKTEELTQGKILEFALDKVPGRASQIGFFFTGNGYTFEDGVLVVEAFAGEQIIGSLELVLSKMEGDQFLFVPLSEDGIEGLKVRISCNAKEKGPSVWLNETTLTPGEGFLDGERLSKSLVYNLTYTVNVHHFLKPLLIGLLLFLFGVGVYGAGGFKRRIKNAKKERLPWFLLPTRREFLGLVGVVLLVAFVFFYLYDAQIRIAQNTTQKRILLEADGEVQPVTKACASIQQIVKPLEERLTGFGVRFYIEEGAELLEGQMHAVVTDITLNKVLCETDVEASQFVSGEYAGLLFTDSQMGVSDHSYQIDLTFSPELWDSGLCLMTSEEGLCVNAYLYFNIFLKRFFFFMFLGVEVFVCLFWYLVFVRRTAFEHVLLVTLLGLGLFYNVLLTPEMVPDEAKHMDMAYRYSNEILGYPSLGDNLCLMRADDAKMSFTSSPSFGNYRNIYYGLFTKVAEEQMVEEEVSSNTEGSFLLYAPAVLGMCVARILHLGTVPMLLLARYLNLLVFALLVWAGMRCLPWGKMTLFVLALLPINLQQCTSFSHDAMVHGILFFYCCLCLRAIFAEERIYGQQIMLLQLMALFLVYCKNGSYLPLCFLPLLIPALRYGGKKEKGIVSVALVGTALLAFGMKHIKMVSGMVTTTAATSVVSTGDGSAYLSGYTLGYFLKEPLELIYMLINTILDKGGFYLESLVGYKLGWVEIETSMLVVFLFWFLLFLSLLEVQGERVQIKATQRIWMIFFCLASAGLVLLGMLLSWTPMGHVSIEGVQGRYFLPFLPILLAACKNQWVYLRVRIDRGIAVMAFAGQLLTLVYVIRQVTMV